MYLEIFPADFVVFRVFLGISRDFAEIPEFRRSATARNIRSPVYVNLLCETITQWYKLSGLPPVNHTEPHLTHKEVRSNSLHLFLERVLLLHHQEG